MREAKRLPLGKPKLTACPPPRPTRWAAAEAASLHAFHLGMMIAAALVALGGLIGAAAIRNPRRPDVRASECAGGQLVGMSAPEHHRAAGGAEPAPARAA